MGCPNCISKPSDSMPIFCCWHQQLSTQNWGCRAGESLRGVRTILWGRKEGIRHSGSPPSLCFLKGTQGRRLKQISATWDSVEWQEGCSISCLHPRFLCHARRAAPWCSPRESCGSLFQWGGLWMRTGALAQCVLSAREGSEALNKTLGSS